MEKKNNNLQFEIETEIYQGPLEKLLSLIEEKKLEITEVSLAKITNDFLFFLSSLKEKNPEKEIIQANLDITRNILEVAAEFKVRKIVYVSSFATISHENPPMNESTWNTDFSNDYYKSKVISEQLAWELTEKLDLNLTTILPSGIIGPNNYDHLTTTMVFFDKVLNNNELILNGITFIIIKINCLMLQITI